MERKKVNRYRETQIKTASKGKLIVLLYDGLIRFLDRALESIPEKRYDEVNTNILKAQDIISELIIALNMNVGELSEKLLSIYSFFNVKLIEANVNKDPAPITFVRNMAAELRESWSRIIKNSPNPAMEEMRKEGGIDVAG